MNVINRYCYAAGLVDNEGRALYNSVWNKRHALKMLKLWLGLCGQ